MSATMAARPSLNRYVSIARTREIPHSVRQLGFWSAVLSTVFSVGYGLALIVTMISMTAAPTDAPAGWQGIESFVATFQPVQMLSLIPSLFLAPTFVVLMASIHYYAAPDKRIWSHLGVGFALIYAT